MESMKRTNENINGMMSLCFVFNMWLMLGTEKVNTYEWWILSFNNIILKPLWVIFAQANGLSVNPFTPPTMSVP